MKVSILTVDGFNPLDTFIAAGVLGRMGPRGWRVGIASPRPEVVSMTGVTVGRQDRIEDLRDADAVLIGSGVKTRDYCEDEEFLARLRLDPRRQLIGSQCSGVLILSALGLVDRHPVSTDLSTRPYAVARGLTVVDRPLVAKGNIATAGGCLASVHLAAWVIARLACADVAATVLKSVAPRGEEAEFIARVLKSASHVCDT